MSIKNTIFSKISWKGLETGRMRLAKTTIFKVPDEDVQHESNWTPLHFGSQANFGCALRHYDFIWQTTEIFLLVKYLEFFDFFKIFWWLFKHGCCKQLLAYLLCRSQDIRNIAFDLLNSFPHIGQFNISSVVKHVRHTRWPHGKATLSPSCEQTWQFIRSTDKWVIFFNSFLNRKN